MSALNITTKFQAYSDPLNASQPLRQNFSWERSMLNLPVSNPRSESYTIAAGQSLVVLNALETTGIDGTTTFSVSQSPLNINVYRFTATSGTAPAFRTSRAITVNTHNVSVVVNTNGSATFSVDGGGAFTGVQASDVVFIPGVTTGDSSGPFNPSNEGFWVVNGVISSSSLNLVRPAGEVFQAFGQTVAISSTSQLIAFSAAGIQTGDSVQISAGFSPATQGTYIVGNVTPSWFEVQSATPLPLETGILPGATGMLFYTAAKRWIRVEVDQLVVLKKNGDTGSLLQVAPIIAGDSKFVGWFESWGPTFALTIVNKAIVPVNVEILSIE